MGHLTDRVLLHTQTHTIFLQKATFLADDNDDNYKITLSNIKTCLFVKKEDSITLRKIFRSWLKE